MVNVNLVDAKDGDQTIPRMIIVKIADIIGHDMNKVIKIILAVLFFLCLLDMPYGFFQVVRFAALVGFSILAYQANEIENKTEMLIFICLAVLFQPLLKISLGRQVWNVVDVIVGVALIVSIFISKKKNSN
jgi:hypothetical protein